MSPRTASILRWTALALAGLVIAIAVGVVAGKVTSQQIGLSSEPFQAGEALAPKQAGANEGAKKGDGGKRSHGDNGGKDDAPTTTATPPPATTTPTTAATPTTAPTPPGGTDDYGGGADSDDD